MKSIDDCCLAGWACIERKTLLRDDRRYIYLRKEIDKEIYIFNPKNVTLDNLSTFTSESLLQKIREKTEVIRYLIKNIDKDAKYIRQTTIRI